MIYETKDLLEGKIIVIPTSKDKVELTFIHVLDKYSSRIYGVLEFQVN